MYLLKHKGQVATYNANVYNKNQIYTVHFKRLNKIHKIDIKFKTRNTHHL